jgi:ubiquinol-cytochrome c reductase cytochrome b subunit
VAVITGILLLPFFRPSMATVVYHGRYRLLDGVTMSRAYQSVLATSLNVHGGLLIRQVHHWSADIFVAAICLRLLRVFFRGRFSGPRLRGWLICVTLLPLGMLTAYTGTILPDDMLSGGSLSVVTGVLLAVPLIGTRLVALIFGGVPPGHVIIGRDYWVHIIVLPALTGVLLLASYRPSRRWLRQLRRVRWVRWVRHVRVDPLLPFTCAFLVLLGAIAQINPVWLIGPYRPGDITAGAVPDWYMGFLDGPLRLMPAWQVSLAGHPLILAILVPGVLVPGAFFTLLAAYPLLERRLTRGQRPRPGRPLDAPVRTAIGVAGVTFYGALWAAAANDQIAYHLQIPLYTVTWFFRIAALAGPPLAYIITQWICLGLTRRERDEAQHGLPTGRIVMTRAGEFSEITEPVPPVAGQGSSPHETRRPATPGQREHSGSSIHPPE